MDAQEKLRENPAKTQDFSLLLCCHQQDLDPPLLVQGDYDSRYPSIIMSILGLASQVCYTQCAPVHGVLSVSSSVGSSEGKL
jgi:hypothetical protein